MGRSHEDWIEVTSFQWGIDGENDSLVFEQSGPEESSRLYVGETAAFNYSKCEFEPESDIDQLVTEDVGMTINFAKMTFEEDLG